ncbi:hypothetical protein F5144DRAFT_594038 [Chaetomium tenue]|uniref:Uncharacterized protein n=1 Tax=Chaetomium tenue TaxID=1854479 RepID=A0ACB7P2E1_9PEZI|nr:hypothetical protein F5144DRAFT_594038 [Chaetomium globosum]
MSILTPETVLLITEELQLCDIRALMNTSQSNRKLIKSYEQSIAKTRISRLILVPQFQPLDRPVISSLHVKPTVLGPTNFEVVGEVELRTATSFERFFCPMLTTIFRTRLESEPPTILLRLLVPIITARLSQNVIPGSLLRFLGHFEETLQLMDRIKDCEATIRHEFALDPTPPYPDFGEDGLNRVIHRARQNLIAALSPLDLAFLHLVTTVFGLPDRTHLTADDGSLIPHDPCNDEVLLRAGTMGVYIFLFDMVKIVYDAGLADEILSVASDMVRWDSGEKSQAPDWSPTATLEPLKYLVRRTFGEKLERLPEQHLKALADAPENDIVTRTGNPLKNTPDSGRTAAHSAGVLEGVVRLGRDPGPVSQGPRQIISLFITRATRPGPSPHISSEHVVIM